MTNAVLFHLCSHFELICVTCTLTSTLYCLFCFLFLSSRVFFSHFQLRMLFDTTTAPQLKPWLVRTLEPVYAAYPAFVFLGLITDFLLFVY